MVDLTGYIAPQRKIVSDRKIIELPDGKINVCDTTLSSVAYFDASTKNGPTATGARTTIHQSGKLDNPVTAQNSRVRAEKPVHIAIHADMLKVSISSVRRGLKDRSSSGGGVRGNVTGFSRASRKRMIEFMASVRNTGCMLFLTLTFADDTVYGLDEQKAPMFEAFRRRFEREYPGWKALWRIEYQDRKSGLHVGTFVPHFHLLIFTGVHYEKAELDYKAETFRQWGSQAWHEITSSADEGHIIHGFNVSPVRTRRHAQYYIGKYVSKLSNNYPSSGRIWGRIGKFDCSVSETFKLDEDEYIAFRRLIKKWLKTRVSPLPENATEKQIQKHKQRLKKQRKFSGRFARDGANLGCTVFGLGDTLSGTTGEISSRTYYQFVIESQRQLTELRSIDRGYGE